MKRKRILRNKKGFTMIELIATVAIMAIIAGIATPSIYYSTAKRQRSAAENDNQSMFRSAISYVTRLQSNYRTPLQPDGQGADYSDKDILISEDGQSVTSGNGWYVYFSEVLTRELYSMVGMDIPVKYYDPSIPLLADGDRYANRRVVPAGVTQIERNGNIAAGNRNPYIMVQVVRVRFSDDPNEDVTRLIVSYHNDANHFVPQGSVVSSVGNEFWQSTAYYKTNGDNNIVLSYRIR